MSVPEPDFPPESFPIAAEALAAGQRTLAAIVFTDTVGFSALMRKDEERALRLVGRDLERMKGVAGSFGGQVLKSTGDGLLMLFTSAVQAVACALEIQRDFQKQNLELPREEQMRHRIGIHLGDIFQHGGDVMGDGVNIAARLQTEAMPGGICLSKTVYDVVHNRLPFYVNDLGARKLKNIGKVTAYQISPMEAGSGSRLAWYRWRPWIWRGGGLLAVLLVIALAFKLGGEYRHAQYVRTHLGAAVPGAKGPAASVPAAVTAPASPPAPPHASPGTVMEVSETAFQDASFNYMTRYDFAGMENWINGHDWPGKSANTLAQVCPQLDELITWAHVQLQKYSAAKPLKVVGQEKIFYYWPAPFGGVKQKIVVREPKMGEEPKLVSLSANQIPPLAMAGIIRVLLKEEAAPEDELTLRLGQELHLFIQTYHVVPARKPAAAVAGPL